MSDPVGATVSNERAATACAMDEAVSAHTRTETMSGAEAAVEAAEAMHAAAPRTPKLEEPATTAFSEEPVVADAGKLAVPAEGEAKQSTANAQSGAATTAEAPAESAPLHIEPDHYYDGGGVPVFKPVSLCKKLG